MSSDIVMIVSANKYLGRDPYVQCNAHILRAKALPTGLHSRDPSIASNIQSTNNLLNILQTGGSSKLNVKPASSGRSLLLPAISEVHHSLEKRNSPLLSINGDDKHRKVFNNKDSHFFHLDHQAVSSADGDEDLLVMSKSVIEENFSEPFSARREPQPSSRDAQESVRHSQLHKFKNEVSLPDTREGILMRNARPNSACI